MPLLPYTPRKVAIQVANRQFGDQQVAQVATLTGAIFAIDPHSGELSITLNTLAEPYALVAGELAEPIAGRQGISSYPVPLFGNNNCAVYHNPHDASDPRNGEEIAYRLGAISGEEWQRRDESGQLVTIVGGLEALEEPLQLQGNVLAEQMADLFELVGIYIRLEAAKPTGKYSR